MRELIQQLYETTFNVNRVAEDFLAVIEPKDRTVAAKWLEVLITGYNAGGIRGADLKEVKFYLGRHIQRGFEAKTDRFWHGKGGEGADPAFHDHVSSPMNLHDVISRKKKLDKLKPTTKLDDGFTVADVDPELIRLTRAAINAAWPVAMMVKSMKGKIIKGPKPLSPAKALAKAAALAKKDMKTCACCFRAIARVKNGKIADHGFTLGNYWGAGRAGSCPGMGFRPLEVSNDGLKYMIKQMTGRIRELKKELRSTPRAKTLEVKVGWGGKFDTLTPDDPRWPAAMKSQIYAIEAQLKIVERDLVTYKGHLRHWKEGYTGAHR